MSKPIPTGTEENNENSKFQVSFVDTRNKSLKPSEYPRTNRFFENIEDRNAFVKMLEHAVIRKGGSLVQNANDHPLFITFKVYDKGVPNGFEVVVYH